MKKYFVTVSTLAFALLLSACSNESDLSNSTAPAVVETPASNDALTPEETLARLKELAAAGDWETYVDDFYGESHKFEGKQERRDAVVTRFRDKWAADVNRWF